MINTPTKEYKVNFKGRELSFLIRDKFGVWKQNICDQLILKEMFELNTYSLSEKDFENSGVFLDIGANIGAASILAHCLGAKRIICYEPEEENAELLIQHLDINKVSSEVHIEGVWSTEGEIQFVPSQGASTSREEAILAHKEMVVKIKTVSLQRVLERIQEVDVLKCDCEGAEYAIFNSLLQEGTLNKVRKIVMEYHQTNVQQFGEMVATLVRTHNVQMFGDWKTGGGQLVAIRYGN